MKSKEDLSRRGRTSRNKGANFERQVAKIFEYYTGLKLSRTPLSGGYAKAKSTSQDFKGDLVCLEDGKDLILSVEVKNQKTWSLPAWLRQSEEEAPEGKIPCVVFHQHNTSNNYIALPLEEFLALVGDSVVKTNG